MIVRRGLGNNQITFFSIRGKMKKWAYLYVYQHRNLKEIVIVNGDNIIVLNTKTNPEFNKASYEQFDNLLVKELNKLGLGGWEVCGFDSNEWTLKRAIEEIDY